MELFHEEFDKFQQELETIKSQIFEKCKRFNELYKYCKELEFNFTDDKSSLYWNLFRESLHQGEIRIVFSGLVNAGKSLCINEFLENIYLPSKETPTTWSCTVLFYSEIPILYSLNNNNRRIDHNFDGYNVSKELVGRELNDNQKSIDLVYYVGINSSFLKNNIKIIDSPGLYEESDLTEGTINHFKFQNPHILIYVFDCGQGLLEPDHLSLAKIYRFLRNDIRTIFLFNKYDKVCIKESTFGDNSDSSDEPNEDIIDDGYDEYDDDDEYDDIEITDKRLIGEYQKYYDSHYQSITRMNFLKNWELIGYSAKVISNTRKKKCFSSFILSQHLNIFKTMSKIVNAILIESANVISENLEIHLFEEFKDIYIGILRTRGKFLNKIQLTDVIKSDLLKKFDKSHKSIRELNINRIATFDFYGAIREIIKNHNSDSCVKFDETIIHISNDLGKFFIDRYFNIFSNMINNFIANINFKPLLDALRFNNLDKYYAHSQCQLKIQNQNSLLEQVIVKYFTEEISVFLNKYKLKTTSIASTNYQIEFFKQNFNYKADILWERILSTFVNVIIEEEENLLLNAIESKSKEINNDYILSKNDTDEKIKSLKSKLELWFYCQNLIVDCYSINAIFPIEERKIYELIKNDNFKKIKVENIFDNGSIIYINRENISISNISTKNNEIILYFLRTKYFSSYVFDFNIYTVNNSLYIFSKINSYDKYNRFRDVVTSFELKNKALLVEFLITFLSNSIDKYLPIINFSPDMIFLKIENSEITDIKVLEIISRFNEWKLTTTENEMLKCGEIKECICLKYPFYKKDVSVNENSVCMIYSTMWIIMMTIANKCENLMRKSMINNSMINQSYRKILEKNLNDRNFTKEEQQVIEQCMKIIEMCLRRPFKDDLKDILKEIKLIRFN